MNGWRHGREGRKGGVWSILVISWLCPFLLAGIVLTVSVFGAYFGVPLLLLVGPPTWWEVAGLHGDRSNSLLRAIWLTVAVGATLVGSVIGAAVAVDDVDTGPELTLAVTVAMGLAVGVTALVSATARLRRTS